MKSRLIKNILKALLLSIFTFAFFIHSNNVFAQIDIKTIMPTFTPTQLPSSQSNPTELRNPQLPQHPAQNNQRNPRNCVNHGRFTNKFSVGGNTYGQGKDGEWYAKGGKLRAEDVLSQIDEIVEETGIVVDPDRLSSGADQNAEGVLRLEFAIDSTDAGGVLVCDALRLTGYSPTIFTYSPNTKVQPLIPVFYIDNNREYFYYEYDSTNISFKKPTNGWIVDKKNLKAFSKNISQILGLNPLESERLLFELNFSAVDVKSDKLFIGLIPREEVDKKLPLKIESLNNPKVIRYHFYVAKAKNNVKPPQLNPVQRDEFLILELGSFSGK